MAATTTMNGSIPIHPDFSFMFNFERNFNPPPHFQWLLDNTSVPAASIVLYLLLVFLGPVAMHNRPPMKLKTPLFLWNVFLAVFSILFTWRTLPELLYMLRNSTFDRSVCTITCLNPHVCGFWIYLFTFSKLFELNDTVFLVLRRKRIIFLHWYHHVTVLIVTWALTGEQAAPGRWFSIVNGSVHSVMYTYFALTTLGIRFPKFINVSITTFQLAQMFVGVFITAYVVYVTAFAGATCDISSRGLGSAIAVYLSYLGLFVNYFYHAYIAPPQRRVKQG